MSVPKLHLFAFNPDSIPVADRRPNGGYRFGAEAHVYFAASQIRQLTSVDPAQAPAAVGVLVQAVQAGENHCLATITTISDYAAEWTCLCGGTGTSDGGVYGAIADHG